MSDVYDKILVLNFGSQYFHLIVKRINALQIFSIVKQGNVELKEVQELDFKGVILSGGPRCCLDKDAPHLRDDVFEYILKKKVPILGICYGMQEIALKLNGGVRKSNTPEHGLTEIFLVNEGNKEMNGKIKSFRLAKECRLYENVKESSLKVWMNHLDEVYQLPPNFDVVSYSANCLINAYYSEEHNIYGVQYHPEVYETEKGDLLFHNFIINICGCKKMFNPIEYHTKELERISKDAKDHYMIAAMSGGIDSTVAAALTYRVFKDRFFGIFIDNGLLRKNEAQQVITFFKETFPDMNVKMIDASEVFLSHLKGVTDPEIKRKTIGKLFIEEFEKAVKSLDIDITKTYLLQGTLYPDVIESSNVKGGVSDTIKTHHNVGGLPPNLKFKLFEPFRYLFKDDVRKIAADLKLPKKLINRHPFPGPGLSIRIIGEVTKEKLRILRDIDDIYINDLIAYDLYDKIDQAFAVLLTNSRSVGVRGDARSYEYACILRAVKTVSFMTANWYQIPYDILEKISTHILSEVKGINKVLYDISPKPPSTIEFE